MTVTTTKPALVLPHKLPWAAQARLMAAYAAECLAAAQQAAEDGLQVMRGEWQAEAVRAEGEARKYRGITDGKRGRALPSQARAATR